jgi:hypothetical protein
MYSKFPSFFNFDLLFKNPDRVLTSGFPPVCAHVKTSSHPFRFVQFSPGEMFQLKCFMLTWRFSQR